MGRQATMNSLCRRHPHSPSIYPHALCIYCTPEPARLGHNTPSRCRTDKAHSLFSDRSLTSLTHTYTFIPTHILAHSPSHSHTHILTQTCSHTNTYKCFLIWVQVETKGQPGFSSFQSRSITLCTWLLCTHTYRSLLILYKNVDHIQQLQIQHLKGNG